MQNDMYRLYAMCMSPNANALPSPELRVGHYHQDDDPAALCRHNVGDDISYANAARNPTPLPRIRRQTLSSCQSRARRHYQRYR